MSKKYVIAFDQGTTSTRTILFDEKGTIKGISQKELTQHYPKSGWVEHDPIEIYNDQRETFETVLAESGVAPEAIAAIGITNQRETTVVWDKETGAPIYNAIVWLDNRTKKICKALKKQGLENYVRENTGLVIDSYFSATKLAWILDNVAGAREKAEAGQLVFGTIDSWLIYKFSVEKNHVTDHTNASRTLLYNIKKLEWDRTMLEALNIPATMLPKVQNSSSDFGTIAYKNSTIPIYGVAGDQQAALFGQGGFKEGIAKNTYGTGCFMLLNTGSEPVTSKNGLITTLTCSLEKEAPQYALEGSIFIGGASIQWLRDNLNFIKQASETERICFDTPPLTDVYVVPAFAGLGAPHWDVNVKGAIYGLTLDSGKNEIIKATVEALALQTKDVIAAMIEDSGKKLASLKVDGGASENKYLMQFQADMLDVPVEKPKMTEVTALGAALLAGLKAGVWNQTDIETLRDIETIYVPKMEREMRKEKYNGWLEAIDRTKIKIKLKKGRTKKRFSILDRNEQILDVANTNYDLVIIGGGITGAGIAIDAASRGLKTCLIEKNDFASGTSNKSTKLIHGGLRYLKQFEIKLVKESGRERAIVHKLAPHLVVPEKMLLPLTEDGTYGKVMTSIGLKVYDLLASVEGDDRRQMLSKSETITKEPLLDQDTIVGGGYYSEYRTDDARLTIELLKKASELGATALNYCEMESFVYNEKGKVKSINCKDHNTGEQFNISAKTFVSAAGPWVDQLREKDKSNKGKHLHLTKGVHLVFPREKLPLHQSIYFDVPDGRMLFAIPRGRVTYVGTTDTFYDGSLDRVVTTQADINYLLDAVNATFPAISLTEKDIESSWAGLRPLIHEDNKDPSELSRKDELFISDSGLISIAGGKLTGYRKMAQRAMEAVLKNSKKKQLKKLKDSHTDTISLASPSMNSKAEVKDYCESLKKQLVDLGVENPYVSWYLTSTYGKQADSILKKLDSFSENKIEIQLIRAELWYCIEFEMTNSLADFFVRRTGRLYFDIDSVIKYRDIVLKDFITYFNWDAKRIASEKEKLDLLIKDTTTFYTQEFS